MNIIEWYNNLPSAHWFTKQDFWALVILGVAFVILIWSVDSDIRK